MRAAVFCAALLASALAASPISQPDAPSAAGCVANATFGCINGVLFNHETQYVCGVQQNGGREPIYLLSETGCCASGIPFELSTQYCCYDGVHNNYAGSCVPWTPNFPTNCYCDAASAKAHDAPKPTLPTPSHLMAPIPDKVSVWPPNNGTDACTIANPQYGCLNGYPYLFSAQYSCGDWLLNFATTGCCGGAPYSLTEQSCCFANGVYTVFDTFHACSCEAASCL